MKQRVFVWLKASLTLGVLLAASTASFGDGCCISNPPTFFLEGTDHDPADGVCRTSDGVSMPLLKRKTWVIGWPWTPPREEHRQTEGTGSCGYNYICSVDLYPSRRQMECWPWFYEPTVSTQGTRIIWSQRVVSTGVCGYYTVDCPHASAMSVIPSNTNPNMPCCTNNPVDDRTIIASVECTWY